MSYMNEEKQFLGVNYNINESHDSMRNSASYPIQDSISFNSGDLSKK